MKSNFIILFFLLSFFNLIWSDSIHAKKGYLINPNGIFLYKSKQFKDKKGIIKQGEEFHISDELEDKDWIGVETKTQNGYIHNNDQDYIVFDRVLNNEYLVSDEKQRILYEKPYLEANPISKIDGFSVLSVLEKESSKSPSKKKKDKQIWFKVKINNKVGFLVSKNEVYTSKESAMDVSQKKEIALDGFALVIDPIYLKEPNGEIFTPKGASKKNEFVFVVKERTDRNEKFFLVEMKNASFKNKMQATPIDFDEAPFQAWISETNAKYFTPTEFSYYTLQKSSYKGDIRLLKNIFAANKDLPLNFQNVYFNPISDNKTDYFIVTLFKGYENSSGYGEFYPVSFVVKKVKSDYKVYNGDLINSGKFQFIDLDRDGIPEVFTSMETVTYSRTAFSAPRFYAYIDEAYREIPLPGNFLDTYKITENFLYTQKEDNPKSKVQKYKYQNGEFIKIKN